MSRNKTIPARRPQTTFRADADFLRKVDERALLETAQLGVEVSMSDLIRRGLQLVLDSPPPRGPRPQGYDCIVTPTMSGRKCLTCGGEFSATADPSTYLCPKTRRPIANG